MLSLPLFVLGPGTAAGEEDSHERGYQAGEEDADYDDHYATRRRGAEPVRARLEPILAVTAAIFVTAGLFDVGARNWRAIRREIMRGQSTIDEHVGSSLRRAWRWI